MLLHECLAAMAKAPVSVPKPSLHRRTLVLTPHLHRDSLGNNCRNKQEGQAPLCSHQADCCRTVLTDPGAPKLLEKVISRETQSEGKEHQGLQKRQWH